MATRSNSLLQRMGGLFVHSLRGHWARLLTLQYTSLPSCHWLLSSDIPRLTLQVHDEIWSMFVCPTDIDAQQASLHKKALTLSSSIEASGQGSGIHISCCETRERGFESQCRTTYLAGSFARTPQQCREMMYSERLLTKSSAVF